MMEALGKTFQVGEDHTLIGFLNVFLIPFPICVCALLFTQLLNFLVVFYLSFCFI